MRTHNWSKTTERLLKENESGRDEELARFVANEIVAASASGQATYSVRNGVKPILPYLLREYRDVTWSTFSSALLRGEEERNSDLADILGYGRYMYYDAPSNEVNGVRQDPLFDPPFDDLLEWSEANQEQGHTVLARMIPLLINNKEYEWHPFATAMIDSYGNRDDFISILEEKTSMFSWRGSALPHYQQRIRIYSQLLSHPHRKVREWAAQKISVLQEGLEKRSVYEDERFINYY
jgi:hypothetical protein